MMKERYKLREDELIALIRGKSLHFIMEGEYHVEILPPTYGVTVKYDDWTRLITFLRCSAYPDCGAIDELIKKIEDRK